MTIRYTSIGNVQAAITPQYDWDVSANWTNNSGGTGVPGDGDVAAILISTGSSPGDNPGYEVIVSAGETITVGEISIGYNGLNPSPYYQDAVLQIIGVGASLDIKGDAAGATGTAVAASSGYDSFLNIDQGGSLELDGSTTVKAAVIFGTYSNNFDGTATTWTPDTVDTNELIIGDSAATAVQSPIYGLVSNNEIILKFVSGLTSTAGYSLNVSTYTGTKPNTGTWSVLNTGYQLDTVSVYKSGVTAPVETLVLAAATGTDPFQLITSGGDLAIIGCFSKGTHILSERGEIAVEDLVEGENIVTARGELRPISWIGRLYIDLARHARPEAAQPIRIQANALADGLPHRDLIVSPDHAFLLDGLLIEAKHLVNGATIIQETRNAVTYYHVELESHDILLAEGAPAESYLESNNRETFDNAGTVTVLHPVFETSVEGSCYPRQNAGPAVEAARDRLRRRALGFGFAIRNGMEAWVENSGRRIMPVSTEDGLVFQLDAAAGPVRLRSASGVPAELSSDPRDRRILGLSVLGGVFAQGETRIEVSLQSDCLAEGFYAAEDGKYGQHRWTNGNAAITLPPGIDTAQPFTLILRIAGAMQSWQPAIAA